MSFDALNKILSNVGGFQYNFDAFKKVYDSNSAVKKLINKFDKDGITLDTNKQEPNISTKKGDRTASLSTMAKRATKKRQ